VAVADDLAASLVILEVGVVVDPGGDLGLDGLARRRRAPSRRRSVSTSWVGARGTMRISVVD
jgi:hypothetical protein